MPVWMDKSLNTTAEFLFAAGWDPRDKEEKQKQKTKQKAKQQNKHSNGDSPHMHHTPSVEQMVDDGGGEGGRGGEEKEVFVCQYLDEHEFKTEIKGFPVHPHFDICLLSTQL